MKGYSGYALLSRHSITDTLNPLELSHADRNVVENMDLDAGHSIEDTAAVSHIAPPSEEGLDISHEGGEYEAFEDLIETLAQSGG